MTDFVYTIKAHPTTYAGVNFRSRLEATWAAFFDLQQVRWEYEPVDFEGWSPDFILYGDNHDVPTMVEIKPITALSDLSDEYVAKVLGEGHNHHRAVFGLGLWSDDLFDYSGWIRIRRESENADMGVRTCQWYEFLQMGVKLRPHEAWAVAKNTVQWKPA